MAAPKLIDELFFINIVLLVLMIIYNGPKSDLYLNMTYIIMFMYLVPIFFKLFNWPEVTEKPLFEIFIGGAVGAAFIFFYQTILKSMTPMSAVFATTAFEGSSTLENLMTAGVIPTVESVLFFVVLPAWILWKMGKSLSSKDIDFRTVITAIAVSAVFTVIHSTAFGITNNTDLMAVFIFSIVSFALVIITKTILPAIIMHVVINSYSIGLIDILKDMSSYSLPLIVGVVAIGWFMFSNGRKVWA